MFTTAVERNLLRLFLSSAVVLLTSCEVVREERFTGQITAAGITHTLKSGQAPLGSLMNDPVKAEWTYYPEGVNRILIIRGPRVQDYTGFQVPSPTNRFGVFVRPANPQPREDHTNEIALQGTLVFRNQEGTAFDVNAQSLNQREGFHGSLFVTKYLEVHPTFPFAVLLQFFGIGVSRTVHPVPQPSGPQREPDSGTNPAADSLNVR